MVGGLVLSKRDKMQDITEAVNLLTLPIRTDYWQPLDAAQGGRKLHTSYAPALLDQLRESLASGGGTGAVGVGEKRTRSLINAQASEFYEQVRVDVHYWLVEIGGTPTTARRGEVKDELRRWLRLYSRYWGVPNLPISSPQRARVYKSQTESWVKRINAMFEPPKKIELLVPCPGVDEEGNTCGQRYWLNDMGDRESSLVALTRGEEPMRIHCRSCGATWVGTEGIILLGQKV